MSNGKLHLPMMVVMCVDKHECLHWEAVTDQSATHLCDARSGHPPL